MKDSVKRNNTTLFLLPILGERKELAIDDHNFENAYIQDRSILIKYSDTDDIKIFFNNAIEEVFDLFQNGQYSKFPNHIKQKILAFWGITSKEERLYQILYPESYFLEANMSIPRKIEIWPRPNMDDEIYKIQKDESNFNKSGESSTESNEHNVQ